jgi:TatA/E family protein of Tat protein translocase
MPFNIGPFELILVLVIVLILFGPGKLPDIGNAIGRGVREFRKASSDLEESIRGDTKPAQPAEPEAPAAAPTTSATPGSGTEQK